MADLSQFREGGPIGSPVTPEAGVANTGGVVALQSLNQLASTGLSLLTKSRETQTKQAVETNKASYLQSLNTIASAQQMGEYDKRTSQAMIRQKYQQALGSGDIPVDDLRKLTSDFIDVGQVVKEGTQEEQRKAAAVQAAFDAKWITPNMSPQEIEQATANYFQFEQAGAKLKRQKEIAETGGVVRRNSQRIALGELNEAYTTKFRSDTQEVIRLMQTGQLSNEEAVQQLNTQWESIQSFISSQGSEAGSDFLTNMTAPMRSMYDNALKVADGSMSLKVYQNQVEKNIAMANLTMTGDPEIARIAAASRLLPNSDVLLTKPITDAVIRVMGQNSDPSKKPADLTDPDQKVATGDYFTTVRQNITSLREGTALDPEESQTQVDTNLMKIIEGVGFYGSAVESPSDLNQVIDFISDPSVGKYLQERGGVPADVAEEAKVMYTEAYRNPAIQAVVSEFESAKTTINGMFPGSQVTLNTPTADAIIPVFSGAGVRFLASPDVNPKFRKAIQMKVKQLNKDAAPTINRLIRTDAHLQGTTDYQKVYIDNFESLFSRQEQEEESVPSRPTPQETQEIPSSNVGAQDDEYYARIRALKAAGATKEDAERVVSFLGLSEGSTGASAVRRAIDEIFGNA